MNDKLIMENYLLVLKSTVEVYVHGTLESSNKEIISLLKNGLDETISSQKRTYEEMTKNGWYTIQNVEPNVINYRECRVLLSGHTVVVTPLTVLTDVVEGVLGEDN